MRTERRQDLKTNELQQQIDDVRQYVVKHAAMLTVVVVAAAIIVGGGFAYVRWQNDRRMEAWDELGAVDAAAAPAKAVAALDELAAKNLTPSLTTTALLKIGDTALRQSMIPEKDPSASPSSPGSPEPTVDWPAKARDAYTLVVQQHGGDLIASGRAMIGLGVLAENQGDFEKARSWYKKITEDSRFAPTPLVEQAKYRLAHLDGWSKPIDFPPPQMDVPIPEGMEAQAFGTAAQPTAPSAATPSGQMPAGQASPPGPAPQPQPGR